jgi:dTDP-4-dehydrorhamnose reductase
LIAGGGGMLGHKLWQRLRERFDTYVTLRGSARNSPVRDLFDRDRTIEGVDADDFDRLITAVGIAKPDVIINAIGIVKQLPTAKDAIPSIAINSLFPHRLANLCAAAGARLIHISTDCVFSGEKGHYTESDRPDADDLYGRSKLLGEVATPPSLTLRTSIIGREIGRPNGLVEWFLSQRGKKASGYRHAIFSGLTTIALTDLIRDVIERHATLSGLYQVSTEPINKYDLLLLLRDAYGIDVEITAVDEPRIDRSLDSSRFRSETQWTPQPWPELVRAMAADPTPYDQWRAQSS